MQVREIVAPGYAGRSPSSLLNGAYTEIIPSGQIVEQINHFPDHAWVGISCSPTAGIGPTLNVVDGLLASHGKRDIKPVPHIAARVVRDRAHLDDIIARLEEAGVRAVFVPGGDSKVPAGKYACALDLLRDMAELDVPFRHIGVAAHPEGHPLVGREQLLASLLEKQQYATYLVTQMCFDPAAILRWLREIRRAGITLHAWLGIPGVMEIPKLLALSLRIGVGQSARMLKKQAGLVRNLLNGRAYRPDGLIDGLLPGVTEPELGVLGFHLYSFNNVAATERWRTACLERYETMEKQDL
jgi:methylenetetrahydrofolate reductase (NADPH)